MAENSKIEWTDHTFNPWIGCTKVSPACDHCYAESWAKRTGQTHLWAGERRRTSSTNWQQPVVWNRKAEAAGIRIRVFCASLADVFDNQAPTRWRDDLWHLINRTPHLDWMLLTKRPQNITKMLPDVKIGTPEWGAGWPNVWLGTTVENQDEADRRIPHLLSVPAKIHFLSCEPLLGAVALHDWLTRDWHPTMPPETTPYIDWVIAGGESGPGARPMHPDWARSLRDQCAAYGAPFFFKQWGEFLPWTQAPADLHELAWHDKIKRETIEYARGVGMQPALHVGKKRAGATLDGREWREMPA